MAGRRLRGGWVFEAEEAFVRAVRELGLTEPADPLLAYACDLARRLTAGELEAKLAVRALFRVWVASDAAPEYAIWLALDDALDALEAGDPPYAYPGATLDTFDDIARREADSFLSARTAEVADRKPPSDAA